MRRPLQSRQSRWARTSAGWLTRQGVHPNTISLASVAFAAVAGACLAGAGSTDWLPRIGLLLLAAVAIQLRLVCNLLDGMVAIEGGKKTPAGELYNDVPDRVSDPLILVGAGYGLTQSLLGPALGPALGWLAALLAVLTAYVRVLGVSAGAPAYFTGPMAKQHRMALLTAACVLASAESLLVDPYPGIAMSAALVVVAIGSLVTVLRRLSRIKADLEARALRGPAERPAGAGHHAT